MAQKQNIKHNAFTLIELLVVIAIISLLSSAVLASLSGARESARDARRASDFNQLRTAVEMYRNDHDSNFPGGGDGGGVQVSENCSSTDLYNDLVDGGYLDSMPTDPAQSTEVCTGDGGDSPTLHGDTSGVDSEYFYGWDSANAGGDYCFSINNFETNDDGGSLSDINEQPDTSFGSDANLINAEFVYCFAD